MRCHLINSKDFELVLIENVLDCADGQIREVLMINHVEKRLLAHCQQVREFDDKQTILPQQSADVLAKRGSVIYMCKNIVGCHYSRWSILTHDGVDAFFVEKPVYGRDSATICFVAQVGGRIDSNCGHASLHETFDQGAIIASDVHGQTKGTFFEPTAYRFGVVAEVLLERVTGRTYIKIV